MLKNWLHRMGFHSWKFINEEKSERECKLCGRCETKFVDDEVSGFCPPLVSWEKSKPKPSLEPIWPSLKDGVQPVKSHN